MMHENMKMKELRNKRNLDVPSLLDDAQTRYYLPRTLLCAIVGIDSSPFTHQLLPTNCQILHPFLVCCGRCILALGKHEGHARWVLGPAECSEYSIGRWLIDPADDADIAEVEDARYFYMFSETTIGRVVEDDSEYMARWVIQESIQGREYSRRLYPLTYVVSYFLLLWWISIAISWTCYGIDKNHFAGILRRTSHIRKLFRARRQWRITDL